MFPDHVQIVLGDLDDSGLVEEETRRADIIFRTFAYATSYIASIDGVSPDLASTNHLKSSQAIARAIGDKGSDSPCKFGYQNCGFWLKKKQRTGSRFQELPSLLSLKSWRADMENHRWKYMTTWRILKRFSASFETAHHD